MVGEASDDAVGAGGRFDEFPSRISEAEADSSDFGDPVGVVDSSGLGEAAGVALGVGTDSTAGLGSGTAV